MTTVEVGDAASLRKAIGKLFAHFKGRGEGVCHFAAAAASELVGQGMILLAIYSAGLGIPFLLAAFGIKSFAMLFARFKHQLQNVERAMGALLVLAGIAFITNATTYMANWLIDAFPR